MKVGDLVDHTIFKDQRGGIIVSIGPPRSGTCDVFWPDSPFESHVESFFLLRLVNESR